MVSCLLARGVRPLWLPPPNDLALVGAAAFASGVTRALSTIVIVFELAGSDAGARVALPLGVACLAAVFVGEAFNTNVCLRPRPSTRLILPLHVVVTRRRPYP